MSDPTAHHVGITVADLDRAVDFYTETFDLDRLSAFAVGGDAFAEAVAVDGAAAEFVHLDGGNGTIVELVAYDPAGESRDSAPPADAGDGPELNRPGVTHLGLSVDDVDAFYAGLDDDVATLSPPRTTESGTTVLFVRDPEGNLIEVLDA